MFSNSVHNYVYRLNRAPLPTFFLKVPAVGSVRTLSKKMGEQQCLNGTVGKLNFENPGWSINTVQYKLTHYAFL